MPVLRVKQRPDAMPTITLNGWTPVPFTLRAITARRASTGPRSCERGIHMPTLALWHFSPYFNGAAFRKVQARQEYFSWNEAQANLIHFVFYIWYPQWDHSASERCSETYRDRTRMDSPDAESVCEPFHTGNGRRRGSDCQTGPLDRFTRK